VTGTQEIAMNSERVSNNLHELDKATKEMAAGLAEVSRNIQLIHTEAGSVQQNAIETNQASEEMLDTANEMEKFVARFKLR
jgi:methyl-accepting chemotaxis protein